MESERQDHTCRGLPLGGGTASQRPGLPLPMRHSILRTERGTNGSTWTGQELRPDRIHVIRQAFDDLIHGIVQREGFSEDLDRIALVGISQGAIMGLDAVASGRWPIGALVTFAGLLPPLPITAASPSASVLLVHGEDDKTIPSIASTLAASRLKAAGINVEANVLPNVGHTISTEGAQIALRFLKVAFDV
jgi:phospholipase/carboxylesterase